MSVKREFHKREDHVLVVVTGNFELDQALEGFHQVFKACRLTGHDRVVIDNRQLVGGMSTTEEVAYAGGAVRHYQDHLRNGGSPLKLAYVGNPSFIKTWQPGVNLARKEGLEVFTTTEMDETLAWLLS
jgi:hypothetical protein